MILVNHDESHNLGVLHGGGLGLGEPSIVLVILGGITIHGCFEVGCNEQRLDLLHHLHQLLGGCPLIAGLEHICADLALLVDVGMVDGGLDGDDWPLEGEVIELKLDFELPTLEGSSLRAEDEDAPERIVRLDDLVSPTS